MDCHKTSQTTNLHVRYAMHDQLMQPAALGRLALRWPSRQGTITSKLLSTCSSFRFMLGSEDYVGTHAWVNLVHVKSADEAICTLTWLCGIFKAPRKLSIDCPDPAGAPACPPLPLSGKAATAFTAKNGSPRATPRAATEHKFVLAHKPCWLHCSLPACVCVRAVTVDVCTVGLLRDVSCSFINQIPFTRRWTPSAQSSVVPFTCHSPMADECCLGIPPFVDFPPENI